MAVVLDTGVALSAADVDEPRHGDCAELLRAHHGGLLMPAPAVAETAWMIESRLGPAGETAFLGLITAGELKVVDLSLDDYRRCVELIDTYADMGLGLVDASVITIAERLGIDTLATLNRRDFAVVRPRHLDAFTLLP
ncbi:MAG: type II toxin-antitoxin system VapC family toxin [Acidimicrobiales bacterium]